MHHAWVRCATGVVATLSLAAGLWACDTPVYQYSMYEWRAERYEVRYFHRAGTQPESDKAVAERLRRASAAEAGSANLTFQVVEVGPEGQVPDRHQRVWRRHRGDDLPLHVITSARGELYAGRLDAGMAAGLVDSPKRRELARALSGGDAGVLVVLADRAAGDRGRVVRVAREAAAAGSDEQCHVGLVVVDRDDPAERWLVRQLLSVEGDLVDIRASMVFGAFGRAHVLPPYVGEGVTAAGLAELIQFMHGPCACELKVANPGIDLLMSWDWAAHLPQWATGQATQAGFVLLDFGDRVDEGAADPDDVEADASGAVATTAVDRQPGAEVPEQAIDVPGSSQASAARPSAAEPQLSRPASPAGEARLTPPSPTVEAQGVEEPAATSTSDEASEERAAGAESSEQGSPATDPEPDGDEPRSDGADATPGRRITLVGRAPELPAVRPAQMALHAEAELIENQGLATSLAARVGIVLALIAAAGAVGTIIIWRRTRETE
ncbi:MAG: hypothetical protein U9R79_09795 [Armatimonadota bacterium]|nr:hypothetical protein [Armatimonadota bacterium]